MQNLLTEMLHHSSISFYIAYSISFFTEDNSLVYRFHDRKKRSSNCLNSSLVLLESLSVVIFINTLTIILILIYSSYCHTYFLLCSKYRMKGKGEFVDAQGSSWIGTFTERQGLELKIKLS